MKCDYHVCGKGFIGCPGDATEYARRLEQLWDELPVSGAKPTLYHWHKHYDPYAGTAAVGSQYRIERTGNPSVNPVFILFAQTIGTPVRPPPEGWRKLRVWLDGNGWNFVVLLGEGRYRDADAVPHGTIPLTGTMFELFDALQAGQETHLVIYDLSRLTEPPSPDTPEHQRQRAWRERLISELGKTYAVKDRAPHSWEEFEQRALKDLKEAFNLPALDPLYGALPSLAAVGVDEPLLFGRDDLIESLSRRIMERGAAFTRVLGVSGAGKSSLLRAGLMGSWFNRSRGNAGLLAKATALLIEPLQLWVLDPDPLKALSLTTPTATALKNRVTRTNRRNRPLRLLRPMSPSHVVGSGRTLHPADRHAPSASFRGLQGGQGVKSLGTVTPISRPIATPLILEIAPFEDLLVGVVWEVWVCGLPERPSCVGRRLATYP